MAGTDGKGMERVPGLLRSRVVALYASSLLLPMSGPYLFPVLPFVATGLGAPEHWVSVLVAAYTVPAVIFGIPMGMLADRYGRTAVFRAGLLLLGVPGLLMALAPSFPWAVALRFVQGVGFAIANPLSIALVSDVEAEARETRAQGIRIAVLDLADFLLPALAGVLVTVAWRLPFLIFAVATPLTLLATRSLAARESDPSDGHPTFREYVAGLLATFRVPGMAAAMMAGFVCFFLKFAVLTYFPVLAAGRMGASPAQVGLAVGLVGLAGGLAALLTAPAALRWGRASVVLAAVALLGIAASALGATGSVQVALGLMVAYGVGDGLVRSALNSLVSREAPRAVRAASVGASGLFRNLGKTVGPLLLGLFAARGHLPVGYLLVGLGGIASLLALRSLPQLEGGHRGLVEQARPAS